MSKPVEMSPIGVVASCFDEKFGTPRQSGLVENAHGKIIFNDEVSPDACRGLAEFSHLWIVFLFDQVADDEVRWLVRPPRLGGNEKKGVFATRSPFRPNRIGLSLVKLVAVEDGYLEVGGLDLVAGTPVLDVKPYLPYVESVPEARGGFAENAPKKMEVFIPPELSEGLTEAEVALIMETLSLDPRPAYHDESERVYGMKLSGRNIRWRVQEDQVFLLDIC